MSDVLAALLSQLGSRLCASDEDVSVANRRCIHRVNLFPNPVLDIEELRFSTLLLSLVLAGDVNLAAIVGACTAEDEPTARAPNLKHAAPV